MPKINVPFESLVADLHSADWVKRCDAARLLGGSRDPRAVDALLPDLGDPDWRVRRNAAQALGALKSPRALEPLIEALKDKIATVRERAAVALGRIKDPLAIPALMEALFEDKKSHVHINEGAYRAIRKFGRKAGPYLAESLKTNPSPFVIDLLSESKYEGGAELLISLTSHADPIVRRKALQALAQSGDPRAVESLLDALVNGDIHTQITAVQSIGQLQAAQAIPKMLDLLQGDDLFGSRAGLHHAITEAFQNFGGIKSQVDNSFPGKFPLTFNAGGASTSLPEALGQLGEQGFQKLNDMLSNIEGRAGNLSETLNLPPEITHSFSDQTWKFGAMFADAREARPERVKLLIELLKSGSPMARAAAALALPWYMDGQALGPLEEAAINPDETVRRASAWALAALKTALHNQGLLKGGE